jgi:hypothetical protein
MKYEREDRQIPFHVRLQTQAMEEAARRTMVALLTAEAKRRRKAERWARVGWALSLMEFLALAGLVCGLWKGWF